METVLLLDDIIAHLAPENIPPEYLISIRVTDRQGQTRMLEGPAMRAWLYNIASGNPLHIDFRGCQLSLNLPKLRQKIMDDVEAIYREVYAGE